MNIAINTRMWYGQQLEGIGYFSREVALNLARLYPEHRFFLFFDRLPATPHTLPPNMEAVIISPPARHPVLWKIWFDIQVPRALKKVKADVFVSLDGFCSLTTRVPQCLVVHDLGFLHQPAAYQQLHLRFYRHYVPKFVKKVKEIATVSLFSKTDLVEKYQVAPEKVGVVYSAVKPSFQPLPYETRDEVKDRYTGGSEYFLYVGALQPRKNLINLLKAYSLFKKRLKSGMKLVLAGRMAWKNEAFLDQLKSYKYREDVVLTGYLEEEELARLTGSAYALVYPSLFEGFGVPVLEGMQCGVPVLTSQHTSMQEIGSDAGLYFDPADVTDMADKLMRIYKDETLRSHMISRGLDVAARYSWEHTARLLWESIGRAAARP